MDFSVLLNRLAHAEVLAAGANPGMADAAAAVVASRLKIAERQGQAVVQVVDEKGTVRIGNTRGDDLDVTTYVREVAKARPVLFRPAPDADAKPSSAMPSPASTGEPSTAEMIRAKREDDARSARARQSDMAMWPNPWRPATANITRAMTLENLDPTRAARLKAEAGVR